MLDLAIPDSGPLITFGLLDRLDLLDRFKCPILVTDMVSEEVLRGPDTAKDKVIFEKWFAERGNSIQTVETTYGAMWKELTPEPLAKFTNRVIFWPASGLPGSARQAEAGVKALARSN